MDTMFRSVRPLLLLIPLGIVAVAVVAGAVGWFRSRRGMPAKRAYVSAVLDLIITASLLGLLILTLAPSANQTRAIEWMPFEQLVASGSISVVAEMVGNVVMLVPVAFLATARWEAIRGFGRVTLAGAALSLFIETMQFALSLGRQPSVTDVIMNTAGAALGYLLFLLLRRRIRPTSAARIARWQ